MFFVSCLDNYNYAKIKFLTRKQFKHSISISSRLEGFKENFGGDYIISSLVRSIFFKGKGVKYTKF